MKNTKLVKIITIFIVLSFMSVQGVFARSCTTISVTGAVITTSCSSGTSVKWICSDPNALNYNPTRFGRHRDSVCEYTNKKESVVSNKCLQIGEYVKYGDSSDEVKKIQNFLNIYFGKNTVSTNGYFGEKEVKYTKLFQELHKDEILKPWNFTKPTGWFYQTTRKKANQILGCAEGDVTLPNGNVVSY